MRFRARTDSEMYKEDNNSFEKQILEIQLMYWNLIPPLM